MEEFQSVNKKTMQIFERANVKEIKELFHNGNYDCSTYSDIADVIAELVIENSNDFTKDIARRMKEAADNGVDKYFSAKQAWSVAYQVVNNIELYKNELKNRQ